MKAFINENDKYKMNWVQGDTEWGTVKAPEGIEVSCDYHQLVIIRGFYDPYANDRDWGIYFMLRYEG